MSGPDTPTKDAASEQQGNDLPAVQLPNIALKNKLGVGGFGSVYVGYHELMQRNVAIKILKSSNEQNWKLRFQREAQALSKLSHPNIVQVYSFTVTASGQAVIVMEYLDGKNLQQLVDSEGPLPAKRAVPIAQSICDAMQYAHESGVLHRDLKPSNIFICANGQAKILDFGVAKLLESESPDQKLTSTGQFVGTPAYMSPEECSGKPAGTASDIYAIGCILFFMLTGETLFSANTDMEFMLKHCKETPKLKQLALSDDLIKILANALKKAPGERFADCNQFKHALSSDSVFTERKGSISWNGRILGGAAMSVLILVLAGLTFNFISSKKQLDDKFGTSTSHRSVESLLQSANALVGKPQQAIPLLKEAEASPELTEQQRWQISSFLNSLVPTVDEKRAYARKMLWIADHSASKFSRSDRAHHSIAANLAYAETCSDPAEFESALSKTADLLKKLDSSPNHSNSYKLWATYYRIKTLFYHYRSDARTVVSFVREGLDRLNEPIFESSFELAQVFDFAAIDAISLQDIKSQKLFRHKLQSIFLEAAFEDPIVASTIVSMLEHTFGLGHAQEELAFFRNLKSDLKNHATAESLPILNACILQTYARIAERNDSELLSSAELSEMAREFDLSKLPSSRSSDKSQYLSMNGVLLVLNYKKHGTPSTIKLLDNYMHAKKLDDATKLSLLAWFVLHCTTQPQAISHDLQVYIERNFVEGLTRLFLRERKVSNEEWELASDSIQKLEGASAKRATIYTKDFSRKVHELCAGSENINVIAKLSTLNWVCMSQSDPPYPSLQTINNLNLEFLQYLSRIKKIGSQFEAMVVIRCGTNLGYLYELQNRIPDSVKLSDQTIDFFDSKKYFEDPIIEESAVSDWIIRQSKMLSKFNIAVDTKRLNYFVDRMIKLADPMLYKEDNGLVAGVEQAIFINAFTGNMSRAYELNNEFKSLSMKRDCLPGIKLTLLCIMPKLLVAGKINPPEPEVLSAWRNEFMIELSRANNNPSELLGGPTQVVLNVESMAAAQRYSGGAAESVQFTRDVLTKFRSYPIYLDKLHEWKLLDIIHRYDTEFRKNHSHGLMTSAEIKRYQELPAQLGSLGINYFAYWNNVKN